MEIDRLNYAKLIIACLSYYNLEEIMEDISEGITGGRVNHISAVCDVTRAFSIYANRHCGDKEDDILFLKFKEVLDADCTLEKKVNTLLGINEKSEEKYKNEYEELQMKCLEIYHKQIMDKSS